MFVLFHFEIYLPSPNEMWLCLPERLFFRNIYITNNVRFAMYEVFPLSLSESFSNCDVLRDLVSFVQFKKRENTHGGVLLLLKLQLC